MKEVNGVDDESDDEQAMNALDEAEKELEGEHVEDKEVIGDVPPPPAPDVSEEAVRARTLRRPGQPSAEDIRKHRQSFHLPYRDWCKWCVMGKGVHDQHRKIVEKDKYEKEIPCVSVDYTFTGDDKTSANANPVLVSYDN